MRPRRTDVAKGDEFGYFQFGGFDIIVLFQPGVDADMNTAATDYRFGTPIGQARRR